jgi:hypothetical protein
MAIEFECPACAGVLHVADDYVGRTIRCGGCLAALVVPDGPPAPPRRANRNDAPPQSEEEPPRRRKPRPELLDEPPEPKGRSAFFWLVLVGGVILLGLAVCCGGLWFALPKVDWHKHDSDAGRFRAEFPGPVQPDVARKMLELNLNDAQEEGTVVRGMKLFVVLYRDVPAKDPQPDAARLDKLTAEARELLEAPRVLNPTDLKVSGFPARDFEVRSATKGYYVVRVVAAPGRSYTLFAGSPLAQPNDPDATRFRNSFEVLPKEEKAP